MNLKWNSTIHARSEEQLQGPEFWPEIADAGRGRVAFFAKSVTI